jgi:hypothetical protein
MPWKSMNRRTLVIGLFLALVGTLLVASFHFIDDHRWYWDTAPLVSLVAVCSAASAGLLIGHSLSGSRRRRLWLVALGGVLALAWIGSGTMAASLGLVGMNYLPGGQISWDSYSGAYLLGRVDISLLQFATATGLIGGFAVRFGLAPRLTFGPISLPIRARE